MRLVSYNLRLALDSSLERLAEVLRGLDPDVVCLQEIGRAWGMGEPVDMRHVMAHLTGLRHAVFAPALQEGDGQYGIAALSRHPLSVLERTALPQRLDEARVLLGCRVEDPGGAWLLVTSHISVKPEDRPDQFDALTRWTLTLKAREPLPAVVAGDLNAELDEPELRQAMGWLKVRSAHVVVDGDAPKTFPTAEPRLAIDHILVGPEWKVIGAGASEEPGSDHRAVWAELER